LPKPHKPSLKPKGCQRACKANQITAFQDGFWIANTQKHKLKSYIDLTVRPKVRPKVKRLSNKTFESLYFLVTPTGFKPVTF
jgi:hypothetical protein